MSIFVCVCLMFACTYESMTLYLYANAVLLAVSLLSLGTSQFGVMTKEKRSEESKRNINMRK